MRTPGEDRDEDKDHGETEDSAPPQGSGWQPRQPEEERPGGHPR